MRYANIFLFPLRLVRDFINFFIVYLPGGAGKHLRRYYYKRLFKEWGRNVHIDVGVIINGAGHIRVGDNVHIDKYCIIGAGRVLRGKIKKKPNDAFSFSEGELVMGSNIHIAPFALLTAYGGLCIGNNCAVSAGSKIYSLTNVPCDLDDNKKIVSIMPLDGSDSPSIMSPVVLEENVWVGLNSVILPGTVIKKNSFASINSVISGRFEENSYLRGNPARRIADRFMRLI